jgi:hypothetical protein
MATDPVFPDMQGDVRDVWLYSVIPWLSRPVALLVFGSLRLGECGRVRALDLKQAI